MTAPHEPAPAKGQRWVLPALTVLPVVVGSCCCMTPALMSGMPIRPEAVQRYRSPAGEFEVVVWKRLAWPPNEIFDPAMVLDVELCRSDSGARLGGERLELVEDSDLDEAHVSWERDVVVITGLDDRTPRTLRFHLPR